MITALDHIVLVCPSIDDGVEVYSTLLGREPDWRSVDGAGAANAIFRLENTSLELVAPSGGGPMARRLHIMLDQEGPGLKSLAFLSNDLEADRAALDRRALKPDEIQDGESLDLLKRRVRAWKRLRLDESTTNGVRIFVLERPANDALTHTPAPADAMAAIDHVVVNTAQPERAVALYGARLGLRLALDRSNPDWDTRLIFFRVGGVTIELAHKLSKGVQQQADRLWGLSWRTADIEAAHGRLQGAGFDISDIRQGRRQGSRVFTVRGGTMNVPTLVLSMAEPEAA